MPRSSDACERVCVLLMLLELLRLRRPGLRREGPESLLSLVGGRRPDRRPSKVAQSSVDAALAALRTKRTPAADPLDVVIAGMQAVVADEAALPEPGFITMVITEEGGADRLGLRARPGREELADLGISLSRIPRPIPTTVPELRKDLRAVSRTIRPGPVVPEIAREIACAVASPFIGRALFSPIPILLGAGVVGAVLCGLEISDALE